MGPLQKRVIAAVVLIPLVVAAVLWLPVAGFAVVLGTFALAGAVEWCRVGEMPRGLRPVFLAVVAASLVGGFVGLSSPQLVWTVLGAALAWWGLALCWVLCWQRGERLPGAAHPAVRFAAGWLILVPSFLALVRLHQERPSLVLYVLVLIWVADSAAFFAGRRFGRRKLASRVSPGKTWEGVAGGVAGAAVLALATVAAAGHGHQGPTRFVILSIGVALASVLGDLLESLFKRRAGLKDSGTLIPGHGGVLDRIDSLTAAGPCFATGWLAAGVAP